jgi:enoyl-[acyl-carrier-protein] reductase (NADH)
MRLGTFSRRAIRGGSYLDPTEKLNNSERCCDKAKAKATARSLVSIEDVGVATAFLAHDAARLITGETLYVDGGFHIRAPRTMSTFLHYYRLRASTAD